MKRRLFNLVTALSLLLCVATVLLWSSSATKSRMVKLADSDAGESSLAAGAGRVTYMRVRFDCDIGLAQVLRGTTVEARIGGASWQHGGFDLKWHVPLRVPFTSGTGSGTATLGERSIVAVPFWFIVTATGAAPAMWLLSRVGVHRAAHRGLCRRCGYDLRATPGRCPECGTVAPSPSR